MNSIPLVLRRPWRTLAALPALALAACGGDDGPPRLSPATPAAFIGACADLAAKLAALADTTITASTSVAGGTLTVGGADVPAHCLVTGRMAERVSAVDGKTYAIAFQMRLPQAWNGRFYHQGNGGIDGAVMPAEGATGGGPITNALAKGFAVLSSDAGHSGPTPAFGIDPQARLDYGYQAVGTLTPMAKSTILAAYGKAPDRSYFGGCSNGGRHAMVTAARYADEYDGILAGAPGFNLPKAAVANIFGAQRYAAIATGATNANELSAAFTPAERTTVAAAVLARCDALDGLADGMVQDTNACQAAFDLDADVPTCSGARDGSCLTAQQKTEIGQIFSGATTSTGAPVYASFPYDPGIAGADIHFWEFIASLNLDSGAVGLIFAVPPEDPGFNGPAFSLNADIDDLVARINATNATYTESAMSFMTPPNPTNLSTLRNRGGKILVYHGVSDAIFSVNDTETWYQGLTATHGGNAADFARFFRVPGMNHCAGGPSTDQFDMLQALVQWVEQGQPPDRVIATARGAGNPGGENANLPVDWAADRTRPLCAYPKVARYNGTGDVERAESFTCR